MTWNRFGLNHDFIEALGLTWIDNLETSSARRLDDRRHPDHRKAYVQDYIRRYGVRKVEANAPVIQVEAGRELCLDAICKYVPENAPKEYVAKLLPYRAQVREAVEEMLAEEWS